MPATEKRKPRADGLYRVKVYLGKADGKPRYKYVYDADPKEAERKANDVRVRMKKGLNVSADRETFGIWAQRFLRVKKMEVGRSQYLNYRGYLKHFLIIDGIPISKITAYDVQEILLELADKNPSTGKPSAKKTLRDVKNAASQILQLAIENRVIEYNPVSSVRVPKNAPKKTRRALTDEEQRWIETTPHRMQTAAMIMMYSGLRRGEMIPLLWSDIDLDAKTISVNKSVDFKAGKTPLVKPGAKTETSARTVYIPNKLVLYLKNLKTEGLVCPNASGKILTDSAWRAAWKSYMLEIDMRYGNTARKNRYDPRFSGISIEPITSHMLRHTFCTMLYFAGIDVLTAQQQMGHDDPKTTLEIYTHLDAKFKSRQIAKLDEYLSMGAAVGAVVSL